ncbi:hypothetical protein M378DRAFT_179387 [Amanita muscaria Koide BX008]|uniref:Ribophorin II n=1 Tax=Amanita muscaria (strain Koide BX008) TaxID=946122 RepID=A0A0C2X1U9_AMAMK|nr:hypothetical protein M378DRAFT_179387 [Amanita muscaria Koide BX008]
MVRLLPISLLFLAAIVQAAKLTLQSPRIVITTAGSSAPLHTAPLSLDNKILSPVTLNHTDTLKLTFQVVDEESGKGVQPHQTFLRFYDAQSGEEGIQPIRVTISGKAKFELVMAKPPSSLPPTTSAPLLVTLLIGTPDYSPLSADLFDLYVLPSQPAPVHPEEASFHPLPEIQHTFRPEQKLPPRPISAFFALAVLAPWTVLLTLWSTYAPRPKHLFSPRIFPFVATLAAFEGLLFWYWVALRLGDVLLYGAILGLVAFFTGKQALGSIASQRLGRK